MNHELIHKLQYSYPGRKEAYSLPFPLKDSLQLISGFFNSNSTNKLCLVFPSKEFAAQWLSIPIVLFLIENDFAEFKEEILESYKQYRPGDMLILNNQAIVEWVGVKKNGVAFKTKGTKESSGAEITKKFSEVIMLQKAPANRKVLSSLKSVREALPSRNISPIDKLLTIDTYGNKAFFKNKVCLVTRYKAFYDSTDRMEMNLAKLPDYFQAGKIDENGTADLNSPLLLANNFSKLALYSDPNTITKIIIDGFSMIQERGTDFSDIDAKNIPTILITDLSEIESFEFINNYGFEFLNFTKETLNLDPPLGNSPFHAFNKKLKNYIDFKLVKEICQNSDIETITKKIHTIEKDDSNNELKKLKGCLIHLTNLVSRICHVPTSEEIGLLNKKLSSIDNLFQQSRMWLGDSHKPIEESISLLQSQIEKFAQQPSEKCVRLNLLISKGNYDYVICQTEEEVQALKVSLTRCRETQVIAVADVNDNLLSNKPVRAIVTGWVKSNNINRILFSFLFSELTVLFYQFENNYYHSLQRRNRKQNESIKSTISTKGISLISSEKPKGFEALSFDDEVDQTNAESLFDVKELELKLDNAQFSKYIAKGNLTDCIKAKRVDFEYDYFVYSSESHKFLVINELIEKEDEKANLYRKKLDLLRQGDVIALINTDRDILAELVEKKTNRKDFEAVKQWTDLWKNLLKEYFASIGNNFKKLVNDLRECGCKKHEVTIRTWLQDENRIGPDDDEDLISIASMTDSKLLYNNIANVREAIRKMTGWRMKTSDFISDKIRARIHEFADVSVINRKISVEGLGTVIILKVVEVSNVWESIDVRYVNKLLKKETI